MTRQQLLEHMADVWDYSNVEEMLEIAKYDQFVPAICLFCHEVSEQPQTMTGGECSECGSKQVRSCLMVAWEN